MVARFQSVISQNKNTITGKEGTENLIMLPALVEVMLPVRITIFWMMKT
jgi:hypothetical protein